MGEVKPRASLLVPVALDAAAYQLPFPISRLNYLRLDRVVHLDTWGREQRSRNRRERLVSLLTQVVARELLALTDSGGKPGRDSAPLQITVFISHAKADGAHEAEALRSTILGSGQMQAFFDESDLPIGYAFERRLEDAAVPGGVADAQAMVAIYSGSYPSRPWCQREPRLARKPRRRAETGAGSRCWRVKPLIVAASLSGAETRMLGEAGHAPLIAWDPARIGRIVDTLPRELIDAYAKYPDLPQPETRYETLREVFEALGQQIAGTEEAPLDNGLTSAENRRLLQSRDAVEIRRLLKKGLKAGIEA